MKEVDEGKAYLVGSLLFAFALLEPNSRAQNIQNYANDGRVSITLGKLTNANSFERLKAEEEIRLLGTNLLPYLVKQLSSATLAEKNSGRPFSPTTWYRDGSIATFEGVKLSILPRQIPVILAFRALDSLATNVVPNLTNAIFSDDVIYRQAAGAALAAIGPTASNAVPFLITALNDKAPGVRISSALALGEIGKPTNTLVRASLVSWVTASERNREVQEAGFVSLSKFSHFTENEISNLLPFLGKIESTSTSQSFSLEAQTPTVRKMF